DALYRQKHSAENGRLKATFEIIFLIGWAPHESQQKPLQPGSAKHRLADALNAQENKI
ncbi:MAG: SAM-dependent methyltransferase, partial [Alphaproteobacteria bacterium]|nr:SAM-dependent methyltransferase [Alphaproteobacteria bacterium]